MSLKVSGLSKKYGDHPALSKVSVGIEDGESVCILGPPGCGRTILLRLVGGFEQPTKGSICVGDVLYSSQEECVLVERRDLGMVFQSFALWLNMTMRQYVESPLRQKKCARMDAAEKQRLIDRTLESVDLAALSGRYPDELSDGQKQRVALVRAIITELKILLMDEPLSALDAELKINMRKEIQDIHRMTGATILCVTHDQSEVLAMADHIMILKNGEAEQVGTPKETYLYPRTPFAVTFVGKYNLFRGTWNSDRFYEESSRVCFPGRAVGPELKKLGLYPVRPDQLQIEKHGNGIPGKIRNRQYYGREVHCSVKSTGGLIMMYAPIQASYGLNETVVLTKKKEIG